MRAPGNKNRGGEDFGFSLPLAVKTIAGAFKQGIVQVWHYLMETPIVFVLLFLIFLFLLEAFLRKEQKIDIKHPVILSMFLWCIFCAMYTPELYAGVEVSGGVYNMYYQVFLLVACSTLLLIADRVAAKIREAVKSGLKQEDKKDGTRLCQKALLSGILLCFVLCVMCRSDLKESTTYESLEYIVSGQASDYKEQMDLQTDLLLDSDAENVILPFINDVQGPLMHMPVTADEDAWTNRVTAGFYGKESVIAIPREEWLEKYGEYK